MEATLRAYENGPPAPRRGPFVATQAQETGASVSAEGRWVVYQSDESGRPEVYVESFPVPGRKTRVSTRGGVNPMWRGDGGELYYWQEDRLLARRWTTRHPARRFR